MNYNTFEREDPTLYQSSELFFSPESAEQLHMMHYPPPKKATQKHTEPCVCSLIQKNMVLEQSDAKSVAHVCKGDK